MHDSCLEVGFSAEALASIGQPNCQYQKVPCLFTLYHANDFLLGKSNYLGQVPPSLESQLFWFYTGVLLSYIALRLSVFKC